MAHKKIVFVIVEGASDKEALDTILNNIYDSNSVYVHVVHYDITTEFGINPGNIVSKIGNIVKVYAGKIFKKNDFCQIIHITDMDGAFISDDKIVEDDSKEKTFYLETEIRTRNKHSIENRNRRKRENLNRLVSTYKIWGTPYQIYYMSCNLDHVLYGKLNSTDEEKENDSFNFAKKYKGDIPSFLHFISDSEFSVMDDYVPSWKFIKEEAHSLERYTNLGICFKKTSNRY